MGCEESKDFCASYKTCHECATYAPCCKWAPADHKGQNATDAKDAKKPTDKTVKEFLISDAPITTGRGSHHSLMGMGLLGGLALLATGAATLAVCRTRNGEGQGQGHYWGVNTLAIEA